MKTCQSCLCCTVYTLDLQEIDMIAADLTETWSRMAVVDFSKPFLATSLTLLLQASCHLAVILPASLLAIRTLQPF